MATILVVDDHASNREFLVTLLSYQGHRLVEASDGAEALAQVLAVRPDLVVADILMPTMDGYEFVRQLRANPAVVDTPVVFWSASYHEREAQNLARACGVSHILTKPCEPQVVLDTIAQVLSHAPPLPAAPPMEQFDREHLRLLTDKLSAEASALETTNERLAALVDLSLQFASERDPRQLLDKFSHASRNLIGARYGVVAVRDRDELKVCCLGTTGLDPVIVARLKLDAVNCGVMKAVVEERRSVRLRDLTQDAQSLGLPAHHPIVHTLLAAPVGSPTHTYGWIALTDKVGADEFSKEDERLLATLAAQAGRIYENGSLYADVQAHLARLQSEIAQRKQAQEALGESEGRFRQLAENIREAFFLTDSRNTQILYISPAYEEIWGRSCETLYAHPDSWVDSIHPEDVEAVRGTNEERIESGRFDFEYRIVRPDGAVRWIHARGFPIRNDLGDIYRIAGVAEDITERKRAADELRESERRYSDMLGNVRLVSLMLDRDARITYCNDYLLRLTGWRREDALGRNWFENFIPQGSEDLNKVFAALLADDPKSWHHENEILTRSGTRRLIRWNNSLLRSASGEVIGVASIGEDITETKQAEDKIRHLNRVYAVLSGINTVIVHVREREKLFQESCRIVVEAGQFAFAWIGILDQETREVTPVAWAGEHAETLTRGNSSARDDVPEGKGAVGLAIRERRAVLNNDITAKGFGGPRLHEIRRLGFQSLVTLPLFEGQAVVGTLTMYARESNFFDQEEMKLLEELAGDISFAVETLAKEQKLEKLSRIRAVSGEINAAIVRIRERKALLEETCRIASEQGKFEMTWIGTVDAERQEIRPVAWTGFAAETAHAVSWSSITAARGTVSEAIRTRKPAVRDNIESNLPSGGMRAEALKQGCRSTVCLPLIVDDSVVALIVLFATGIGFFDEDELALLNEVAADVSFALQSMSRQEKLDYLAYYDVLTGLPNRNLFSDRLAQQITATSATRPAVAVAVLTIDRFRLVNDALGRQGGDAVLREVAARLAKAIDEHGVAARIGGDAFAVALPGSWRPGNTAHMYEETYAACFAEPFNISGDPLRVSATVGVAIYPADGSNAEALIANAEAALQKAKRGGDRALFYSPEMNARFAESLRLENKLRRAMEREEFVLYYQPKLDLVSGRISGIEALIRWNDPETGLVPPAKFIPLLEETGMILDVGRWAMRKAVAEYHAWHTQGLHPPRIAVNVSPIQLRQKDFVDIVRDAIRAPIAGSHGLDLEITESLIMEDIKGSIEKLQTIKDMGVNIAIDDFGTGYSSLAYLAKLPVNALKIDRSFIITMAEIPNSMTIVSTIISLAHSLDLKVIAEGVETEEQSKFLRLLKCDEIQGYLISKPVPAAELVVVLDQRGVRERRGAN